MTALVIPRPDMAGFNSSDLDDVQTPSSDFFYQAAMVPNASGMFPFSQTGPSTDLLSGSSWDTTGEGAQNFQDFTDNGASSHGDSEDFSFAIDGQMPSSQGQEQPTAAEDLDKWVATAPHATPVASEPMRRVTSRSSTASHKRPSRKTSPKGRPRITSIISQGPSALSGLDMTGNTTSFPEAPQVSGRMDISSCLFMEHDASVMSSQMFFPAIPMDLRLASDGLPSSPTDLALHVAPSQMQLDPDTSLSGHSPSASWNSFSSPESQFSSPAGSPDEAWLPVPLVSSPPDSRTASPILSGQSPSDDRRMDARDLFDDELNASVMTVMPGDDSSLPPSFTSRRSTNEGETSARDHFLYKTAQPGDDGLFHCPWEGQAVCNHKPEKLKCNYDKFVDSHLKPYRCKIDSCENARFSSTACLLRHEREAHAMHGHGDKPFLCTYDGCDRAMTGNGFPRQWNLKDHMRRVHNDNGAPGSPTGVSMHTGAQQQQQAPSATGATKGRKRKDAPRTAASTGNTRKASSLKIAAQMQVTTAPDVKLDEESQEPLIKQWINHHRHLEDLIHGLSQPQDGRTANLIKEAQQHLSEMGKLSHGLGAGTQQQQQQQQQNTAQTPFRRSFPPTG